MGILDDLAEAFGIGAGPVPGTSVQIRQTPEAAQFQPQWATPAVEQPSADTGVELTPQAQAQVPPPPQYKPGAGPLRDPGMAPPAAPGSYQVEPEPGPPQGVPGGSQGPSRAGFTPPPVGSPEGDERQRILQGIPEDVGVDARIDRGMRQGQRIVELEEASGAAREARAERAAIQEQAAKQAAYWQAQKAAAVDEALAKHQARLDELQELSVSSPDKYWNDHWAGPVFGRIISAIAIGLASLGKGPNLAYKQVSDGINRSLDAQRQTFEAKRALAEKYGALDQLSLKTYDDKLDDIERLRATGLNAAAQRLKDMASAMGDADQIRAAQETITKLQLEATEADAKNRVRIQQGALKEWEKQQKAAQSGGSSPADRAISKGQLQRLQAIAAGGGGEGGADEELSPTARAGLARISKHASEREPAWTALDRLSGLAETWSKRPQGKPGLVERAGASMVANPLTNALGGAAIGEALMDKDTQELSQAAAAARAEFASSTGGKAVTEIEERLSVSKGSLNRAVAAIARGEFTPQDVALLREASKHLKAGTLGQGPPKAQGVFMKSREAANKNVDKL